MTLQYTIYWIALIAIVVAASRAAGTPELLFERAICADRLTGTKSEHLTAASFSQGRSDPVGRSATGSDAMLPRKAQRAPPRRLFDARSRCLTSLACLAVAAGIASIPLVRYEIADQGLSRHAGLGRVGGNVHILMKPPAFCSCCPFHVLISRPPSGHAGRHHVIM